MVGMCGKFYCVFFEESEGMKEEKVIVKENNSVYLM